MQSKRDHGGGLDSAISRFGGNKSQWLDLSTGINPCGYPIPNIPMEYWYNLPDQSAQEGLIKAARNFWRVPTSASILPSAGVSQLIAALPRLLPAGIINIQKITYNEHEASFRHHGWKIHPSAKSKIIVHPNNPDGKLYNLSNDEIAQAPLIIIDESFCETCPDQTMIKLSQHPNVIILKGLGKFWGLAGLRLGFAIAQPKTIDKLRELIGPWAISGIAQYIGKAALSDQAWIGNTRLRLGRDARRLDEIMMEAGARLSGGTDLFRLYDVNDSKKLQIQLAKKYIWSRIFPYSKTWIRLGIPGLEKQWDHLKNGLGK